MRHHKLFEIHGCIEVPMKLSEDAFHEKLFSF